MGSIKQLFTGDSIISLRTSSSDMPLNLSKWLSQLSKGVTEGLVEFVEFRLSRIVLNRAIEVVGKFIS